VLNRVFLYIVLAATLFLASLEVTATETLRAAWADRELPESCTVLRATGRPCPSCGATRAIVSALHGDFAASRRFHPAGIPIAAMLLLQCAMRITFLWPRLRLPVLDIVVSTAMLIAFAIMINTR
jgi:hypothetical protein